MRPAMQIRATRKKSSVTHLLPAEKVEFIIGRKTGGFVPDIDLGPDPTVSRQHARMGLENGSYWIEDLGSRLGTCINVVQIETGKRYAIGPDDVVLIGKTETRLWGQTATQAPPAASASSDPAGKPIASETEQIKYSVELLAEAT